MARKLILLLLCACLQGLSQAPKAGLPELAWALSHPFAALQVKKLTKKCNAISDPKLINTQLDGFTNGGQADAYRHCFFMAAYAQKIKIKKLRKLGKAHEKTNYRQFLKSGKENGEQPDSLASVMDLINNELGFKLGADHKKIPLKELQQITVSEIKNGKAVIMKRSKNGTYLTCEGKEIDLSSFKNKWNIPKCLLASDEH